MDRALELLAERRAKGPAPKRARRPAGRRYAHRRRILYRLPSGAERSSKPVEA